MKGGAKLADATLTRSKEAHQFDVKVTLPSEVYSEGSTVLVIADDVSLTPLDMIPISLGEVEEERIAQRVEYLEAELDLIKSILRKHLSEKK